MVLATNTAAGGSLSSTLFMFALLAVAFYFLIIRPGQTRAKKQAQIQSNLQLGAKVITTAGIHGTVVEVHEQLVVVEVSENARITFSKQAIVHIEKDTAAE